MVQTMTERERERWEERSEEKRSDDDEVGLLEAERAPAFQLRAFVRSGRGFAIIISSIVFISSSLSIFSLSFGLGLDVEGLFGVAQFGEEFTGGEGAKALEFPLTVNETRSFLAGGEGGRLVLAGVEGHFISGGSTQAIRGVEGFLSAQIENGLSHRGGGDTERPSQLLAELDVGRGRRDLGHLGRS